MQLHLATSQYILLTANYLGTIYLSVIGTCLLYQKPCHSKIYSKFSATPPQLTVGIAYNQFPALRTATGSSHLTTWRHPNMLKDALLAVQIVH